MKIAKHILIIFLIILFSFVFLINFFWPLKAGILVSTNLPSTVFINDNKIGETPFEGMFDPGEVVVKILPNGFERGFETRVNLVRGVKTVIQRQFDNDSKSSAGFVGTFEKTDPRRTLLSVVSIPENAQVLVDGQFRGMTPLFLEDVSPGKHEITVMKTDYIGKTVLARFYKGYKFIAFFEILPRTSLGIVKEGKKRDGEYIQLKEFTKGREKPQETSRVLRDLEKGVDYFVLDKSEDGNWYKIKVSEEAVWVKSSFIKR